MAVSIRSQRRAILLLAAASLACAPAPREGDSVHIADESAIIVWDAATKTQHFIRRASFETKAKDFGFLVPTPTVPKLEEADDEAFAHLKRITDPPVRRYAATAKGESVKSIPAPAAAPAVVVIATAKVAGYDASVLEANDAVALDRWLKENGYHSSPALIEWYKPYIAQKWKITAFKIAKNVENATQIESSAVRMTFTTDQPFFPYREPPAEAKPGTARMLRVYLLANARYEGRIGAEGAWKGKAVWSNRLIEEDRASLMKQLKLPESTAAMLHLTEFEDSSSPRPGNDDLFFRTAADQSPLDKPEVGYDGRPVPRSSELAFRYGGGLLAVSYSLFWAPGLAFAALFLLYLLVRRAFRQT